MRKVGTRGSASRAQEDGLYPKEAAEQEEELHPEREQNHCDRSLNKDKKRKLLLPKSVALEAHEAAALRLAHRRSGVNVQDDGIVLRAGR
jgi:hypothetical protein